jgi:nitrogenase molybdenum-iron protein NifN
MPIIHGSQGCATYIRRYVISHFREPIDIASSSFTEETAIFGGEQNLIKAITNVIKQYNPDCIGIATSCLAETIGDDVAAAARSYHKLYPDGPKLIITHTPSYCGSHISGFHDTVTAIVQQLSTKGAVGGKCIILPPLLSPADLRLIKHYCSLFGIDPVILPDYSETLDSGVWSEYQPLPQGGTPVADVVNAGSARSVIQLSQQCKKSAGVYLNETFGVPLHMSGLPLGIDATDRFCSALSVISGNDIPGSLVKSRKRVIDSYIDGHKYLNGLRTIFFGDEDMVVALTLFGLEIGLKPVMCASGGFIRETLKNLVPPAIYESITIIDEVDFAQIEETAPSYSPDLMIGTGKGYYSSQKLGIPLVRAGFPIHDRFGASRMLHIGYEGTLELFDRIINTILEYKQDAMPDGCSYL